MHLARDRESTIRTFLESLRKRWGSLLAATVVGVLTSVALSLAATPVYTAQTLLYVSVRATGADSPGELAQGSAYARDSVRSFLSVATGDLVLGAVIDELGLAETPHDLAERVTVTNPSGTVVIEIAVDDPDPQRAAEIANAIAAELSVVIVERLEAPSGGTGESPVRLQPFQTASTPESPTAPNWPLNLALGLLLGLAAGLGLVGVRESLDTRVRTPDDAEDAAAHPVIGTIPFDRTTREEPIVARPGVRSARAEAFRALRTNVRFLAADQEMQSLLVTSATADEGKSTTAANLAIALADDGARVLLVDADLRRPTVAEYLGIEGAVGLTDVLIGRAELTAVLQPWGRHRLEVLPSGRVPPNPSELLGSRRMRRLHEQLLLDFDFVVFDAPPVLPVTDAVVLAGVAEGALLVIASGRAQRAPVAAAARKLEAVGAVIVGTVLTRATGEHGRQGDYAPYAASERSGLHLGGRRSERAVAVDAGHGPDARGADPAAPVSVVGAAAGAAKRVGARETPVNGGGSRSRRSDRDASSRDRADDPAPEE